MLDFCQLDDDRLSYKKLSFCMEYVQVLALIKPLPKDISSWDQLGYYYLKFYNNPCQQHPIEPLILLKCEMTYIGTADTTVAYQMLNLVASHCNINALASRAND